MNPQVIVVILQVLLITIGLYLAFFKSYFTEKGKNLATFEDIDEITSKVEAIKTDFIRETEKLKLEIQLTNQIKFSLKDEELKALIGFYDNYYLWLNTLLDFSIANYTEDGVHDRNRAVGIINDVYSKYNLSEAKAELFLKDEEIVAHTRQMKTKTLELHAFTFAAIRQYNAMLSELASIKASTAPDHHIEEHSKFNQKMVLFVEKFYADQLERYAVISPMNLQFQKLSYRLLISLSKSEDSIPK
ncbi:MAG: hypothetical protein K9J06_05595 [Flavobacteriales bacterium]|nr:hypothetical protein [Flavobacteriales bacterium]